MTAKEALEYFKRRKEQTGLSDRVQQAEDFAIEALEKQMPCKLEPIASVKAHVPVCGKCRGVMDLMQGELNYCPNCGQRLDWGDDE